MNNTNFFKKITTSILGKEHGMCNIGKSIANSCKECPHLLSPACKKSNKIKENLDKGKSEDEICTAIMRKVGSNLTEQEIRERIKAKRAA